MSIRISHLNKAFGSHVVLHDFCLHTETPLVLTGPSGCGKTTLLRILMGLEPAEEGGFSVGKSISMATTDSKKKGQKPIAAVFQEDRLCPQLSATANLCLAESGLTPQQAQAALGELLLFPEICRLPVAQLSGGQKRRVALLRALCCQSAEVLLLDEPFTGMDAALVKTAAKTIQRRLCGRDCLLVTHDLTAAKLLGWPVVELDPIQNAAK